MSFVNPYRFIQRGLSSSFVGSNFDVANLATYTFSSEPIGAVPDSDESRYVMVTVHTFDNQTNRTISSVTIGGSAAAEFVQSTVNEGGSSSVVGLYFIELDTGTTADIVVTFNGQASYGAIGVYRVIGSQDGTLTLHDSATDNLSNNMTLDVNTIPKGVVIAGTSLDSGGLATWSGLTENYDFDANSTEFVSGASTDTNVTETRAVSVSLASGSVETSASVSLKDI